MKTNIKTLTITLSLMASANVFAGMSGVNVQSNLGEPFSGTITITGKEAEAVMQRDVSISGGGISGTAMPQSNGSVVIRLRSNGVVNEPIVNFVVRAGSQTRQYSAMVNPAQYTAPKGKKSTRNAQVATHDTTYDAETPKAKRSKTRNQRQAAVPTMARSANAQYHRVQAGETLAQVAERYRPHNMSLQRAMRAIVAANPRAFRPGTNGNIMYESATLYIPTGGQFQGYTKHGKRPAQRRFGRQRYAVPHHAAQAQEMNTAPEAAAVEPTVNAPAAVASTPAPAPVQAPETAKTAPAAVASNVAPAVEPVASATQEPVQAASVASSVAASDTQAVSASAASMVEAASAASVAEPATASVVAAPVVQPTPAPVEEESETDWAQLGLMGVGGLAVLGGLGYLLSRRRKGAAPAADEVDTDGSGAAISPAMAAAQRVNLDKEEEYEEFVVDSDDEFVVQEEVVSQPRNEFDLSNFEPENIQPQAPVVETAAQDEDWDEWLNIETPAESTNAGLAAAAGVAAAGVAAATASHAETSEMSDDDAWLNGVLSGEETVAAPAVEREEFVVDTTPEADFDDFAVEKPAVETVADDAFDMDFNVESVQAAPEMPAMDDFVAEELPAADFSVADFETTLPETPEVAVDEPVFDLPESSATDLDFNDLSTPELDVAAVDEVAAPLGNDISFDFLEEEPAPVATQADDSLADLNFAEPVTEATVFEETVAPTVETPVVEDTALSFDTAVAEAAPAEVKTNSAGFVSEAVGMTAPQEAKLELAKMYLEIDDAVAARETLRELIGESHGELQQQAKDLLEELGG